MYRGRFFISFASLLVVIYFALYIWTAVPPLALFLGWQPDTTLTVLQIVEDEYNQYVQPGDIVLAIDGQPVRRGDTLFYPPLRSHYALTIQRDGQTWVQSVPVANDGVTQTWKLTLAVLGLAFWGIGFLNVLFARPLEFAPLYVGFSFQLVGAGILSPAPAQLGAPGGWIVGNCLIFFFPLILLYLGLVPRHAPFPVYARRVLWGCFVVLSLFALLAAGEVLFLFPTTSVGQLTGISLLTILTVLTGVSVVASLAILLVRLLREPPDSYVRQQLTILLLCLALAVVPLFIFVVLPLDKYIFVPYPFVFSLLLFAPAGYFFALHRHGYLVLDGFFSRLITIAVLVLAVSMAYVSGLYFLELAWPSEGTILPHGGFLLLLLGVAVAGQKQVQAFVDTLLYGREPLEPDALLAVTSRLSANPEPATVANVLEQIATRLNVTHIAVLVKEGDSYHLLAAHGPVLPIVLADLPEWRRLFLRAGSAEPLAELPAWGEIALPISVREEMLGLFLLSRPLNGYFNARQVRTLQDIADILASSLQVISLIEVTRSLSKQMIYERTLQRQQLATEIHNEPLQTLALVTARLRGGLSEEAAQEAAQAIRQVTKDLRRIVSDLRPPALTRSLPWMVRHLVREFAEKHDELQVSLDTEATVQAQMPDPIKYAVHYVLAEALNNIAKHAGANQVWVSLAVDAGQVRLEVRDDGIGKAEIRQSLNELLREHHFGIADMHWWASIGGGHLEIEPGQPTGTRVRLSLPYD